MGDAAAAAPTGPAAAPRSRVWTSGYDDLFAIKLFKEAEFMMEPLPGETTVLLRVCWHLPLVLHLPPEAASGAETRGQLSWRQWRVTRPCLLYSCRVCRQLPQSVSVWRSSAAIR